MTTALKPGWALMHASVYEEIPFYLHLTAGAFQRVYPAELKKTKNHRLLAETSQINIVSIK
jgi:hypothetical protein